MDMHSLMFVRGCTEEKGGNGLGKGGRRIGFSAIAMERNGMDILYSGDDWRRENWRQGMRREDARR